MQKIPDNQIAFYQSPDGSVNIEVLYAEENIWLTQKKMAELFNTTAQNITQLLKNIYTESELNQTATCKNFLQVQNEGGRDIERKSKMYSLEAIIAQQRLIIRLKRVKASNFLPLCKINFILP